MLGTRILHGIGVLVVLAVAVPVLATEGLPAEYNIDDVRVVLEHSMYAHSTKYHDTTTIHGNGQARYEENDRDKKRSAAFELPPETVRQIIRNLYEIDFFDLEDIYVEKPIVNFGDDGSVRTMVSISNHQWHIQLTVQIGAYRKSVRYDSHGASPAGLKQFVEQLENTLSEYVPDGGEQW